MGKAQAVAEESIHGLLHHTMALRPDASGLPFFAQKGLPLFSSRKGRSPVPTFLSPHVSQFPRFHMSGQTTWQITYESLLGKMLRLRNSCLWICSVTNKQTWGTPDSDYISNSQERKSHTENKRKKKTLGWPPPFTSPKTAYRANPDIFFLVVELLTFVFCSCSCFLLFFLFLWISHMLTWCVLIICFEECLQTQRTGV